MAMFDKKSFKQAAFAVTFFTATSFLSGVAFADDGDSGSTIVNAPTVQVGVTNTADNKNTNNVANANDVKNTNNVANANSNDVKNTNNVANANSNDVKNTNNVANTNNNDVKNNVSNANSNDVKNNVSNANNNNVTSTSTSSATGGKSTATSSATGGNATGGGATLNYSNDPGKNIGVANLGLGFNQIAQGVVSIANLIHPKDRADLMVEPGTTLTYVKSDHGIKVFYVDKSNVAGYQSAQLLKEMESIGKATDLYVAEMAVAPTPEAKDAISLDYAAFIKVTTADIKKLIEPTAPSAKTQKVASIAPAVK